MDNSDLVALGSTVLDGLITDQISFSNVVTLESVAANRGRFSIAEMRIFANAAA